MTSYVSSWLFGDHAPESPTTKRDDASHSAEETLDAMLEQYQTSALPISSRFNGEIDPQREGKPPSVLDLWRHAWFVATKTKDIVQDVALHHLKGPRRPSWNIEMTLLAAFMRNLANNTHLIDVPTLRFAMSLGGLIPTPSDALITPVSFRVKKRKLRGFLKEWDEKEDGRREIGAEWVVGKRLWARLQREWKGLQAKERERERGSRHSHHHRSSHLGNEKHTHQRVKERVVLFLHGGAYYTASAATHRLITISLSKHLDARVFAINYRLAPDTRFPGPLHDAVSAWFRLTSELGVPPSNVILAGDSAGGGLCLATMMYLRDNGYEMPAGAILMCPWVDLTMSCASWDTNAAYDIITFPTDPADHMNPVACYLGQNMAEYLTHPYASPLFGSFAGLPPLLVQAGDCEVLRDEVTLLAHKATREGVRVRHEVYEDAVHVFQLYPFLEQSRRAFRSARRWVVEVLGELDSHDGTVRRSEKKRGGLEEVRIDIVDGKEVQQRHPPDLEGMRQDVVPASVQQDVATNDVPAPPPRFMHTPVSPPPTPPPAHPASPAPSSHSSSSSSSDSAQMRLSSFVEDALEREIRRQDRIVVDAYGGEEAVSPNVDDEDAADADVADPDAEDSEEEEEEDEQSRKRATSTSGLFGKVPIPAIPSIPWRLGGSSGRTKAQSSAQVPTLAHPHPHAHFAPDSDVNPSTAEATPSPSTPLAYSGPSTSTWSAASGSRTTPSSPRASISIGRNRNHRRSLTGSGFVLTPVVRAPAVPAVRDSGDEASSGTEKGRRRSPTIGVFPLTSSFSSTSTSPPPVSSSPPAAPSSRSSSTYIPTSSASTSTLRAMPPRSRERSRTASHPDMIQLMREYARDGPAQSTTLYAHVPLSGDDATGSPTNGRTRSSSNLAPGNLQK